MLQNRQNQVAAVQIAARRNLDQVALVAGTPRLLSLSKHRLYWSMYGKRPTSPTQPQSDPQNHTDSPVQLGSGSGCGHCHGSRLRNSVVSSMTVSRESERQCVVSRQSAGHRVPSQVSSVPVAGSSRTSMTTVATPVWQIPASAWAAFAIQKAIRG